LFCDRESPLRHSTSLKKVYTAQRSHLRGIHISLRLSASQSAGA
jgi:hypothetical protein